MVRRAGPVETRRVHPVGDDAIPIHLTEAQTTMPLYMDVHRGVKDLTPEALAKAHEQDLKVQHKHRVNYTKYWYDQGSGTVFCLCEAPNREAAAAVHREAHGLLADEIIEVKEGS